MSGGDDCVKIVMKFAYGRKAFLPGGKHLLLYRYGSFSSFFFLAVCTIRT
jgi:hypothetical protein